MPGGQCEHRHALDQAHEQAKRARARADHDRRAQRHRVGDGCQQDRARPLRGWPGAARLQSLPPSARVPAPARGAVRRGTRSAARRRAWRPRAKFSAARRSRSANGEAPGRRALHRVDQVIGDLDALERARQPLARERVAAHDLDAVAAPARRAAAGREALTRHALRVAAERPEVCPSASSRGDQQRADEAARAGDEDAHLRR